ncbi:MAG: TlpA disulfide reductase family protein [Zhongshania sp.]|uniref:TlpA family protein disulfide reductase n=1 Tax=Zhongshania sp. TaxID=1971902 RepID=UPI00260F84C2|nr:TlpA disulfide reductase family protein [Zhongshania sp.]MDF1692900.1 TlpA disulfide reductase family protein [Zhongshania sp.]
MKVKIKQLLTGLLFVASGWLHAAPTLNIADYQGKVVYVDFWASWCGPCRASFPFMNDLVKDYGDNLAVVTVNLDESREDADQFLTEFPANFAVIYDPDGGLAKQYGVRGMPNSFLFNQRGELVHRHDGFTAKDPQIIREQINNTLGRAQ